MCVKDWKILVDVKILIFYSNGRMKFNAWIFLLYHPFALCLRPEWIKVSDTAELWPRQCTATVTMPAKQTKIHENSFSVFQEGPPIVAKIDTFDDFFRQSFDFRARFLQFHDHFTRIDPLQVAIIRKSTRTHRLFTNEKWWRQNFLPSQRISFVGGKITFLWIC